MTLKPLGPLDSYNSLTDEYLLDYFNNKRMRKHLRHMGLITKRGEVVDEPTYRTNTARNEHRDQVRASLSKSLISGTLEIQRSQQAFVRDKLIEIKKVETVNRVKLEREMKAKKAPATSGSSTVTFQKLKTQ